MYPSLDISVLLHKHSCMPCPPTALKLNERPTYPSYPMEERCYTCFNLWKGILLLFPSRKVAKCNIDKAAFMLDCLLCVTIFFSITISNSLLCQTKLYAFLTYMCCDKDSICVIQIYPLSLWEIMPSWN